MTLVWMVVDSGTVHLHEVADPEQDSSESLCGRSYVEFLEHRNVLSAEHRTGKECKNCLKHLRGSHD